MHTAVVTLSWNEIESMVEAIAERVYDAKRPAAIWYADGDSVVPAWMIARLLGAKWDPSGLKFGLYDTHSDFSFYKYEHESEHFESKNDIFLDTLYTNPNGKAQIAIFPWDK